MEYLKIKIAHSMCETIPSRCKKNNRFEHSFSQQEILLVARTNDIRHMVFCTCQLKKNTENVETSTNDSRHTCSRSNNEVQANHMTKSLTHDHPILQIEVKLYCIHWIRAFRCKKIKILTESYIIYQFLNAHATGGIHDWAQIMQKIAYNR